MVRQIREWRDEKAGLLSSSWQRWLQLVSCASDGDGRGWCSYGRLQAVFSQQCRRALRNRRLSRIFLFFLQLHCSAAIQRGLEGSNKSLCIAYESLFAFNLCHGAVYRRCKGKLYRLLGIIEVKGYIVTKHCITFSRPNSFITRRLWSVSMIRNSTESPFKAPCTISPTLRRHFSVCHFNDLPYSLCIQSKTIAFISCPFLPISIKRQLL